MILHKSEYYSLNNIKKRLRIEEESRSREKVMEEFNGGTNKANVVSKVNHLKGKNNNDKKHSRNLWAPTKIKSNSRTRNVHVLCMGNPDIMLGSVGTERTKRGYSECN